VKIEYVLYAIAAAALIGASAYTAASSEPVVSFAERWGFSCDVDITDTSRCKGGDHENMRDALEQYARTPMHREAQQERELAQ
jgi:hypothetical protein